MTHFPTFATKQIRAFFALTHSLSEITSCISRPGWEIRGFLCCSLLDASYILRHKQLQSKPCPRLPADMNKLCKTVSRWSGGCILSWGQKGPVYKLNQEACTPNLIIGPRSLTLLALLSQKEIPT